MKLTAEEIIGLNSLLDGENIPGFKQKVPFGASEEYKEKIAEMLGKREPAKLKVVLNLLRDYKRTNKYLVINDSWYAVLKNYFVSITMVNEKYDVRGIDRKLFFDIVFYNRFFLNEDKVIESKVISHNLEEWQKHIEDGINPYGTIMLYEPNKNTELKLLYWKEGEKYCLDMKRGVCKTVSGNEMKMMVESYGRIEHE